MKKNLKKTITAAEIKASLNRSDYDYDTYVWVVAEDEAGYGSVEFIPGSLARMEFPIFLQAVNNLGAKFDTEHKKLIFPKIGEEDVAFYGKTKEAAEKAYYDALNGDYIAEIIKNNAEEKFVTATVAAFLMRNNCWSNCAFSTPTTLEVHVGMKMLELMYQETVETNGTINFLDWLEECANDLFAKCEYHSEVIADAKYHAYDLNSPFSDDEKELYDSFVAGTDYNPAD